MNEEKSDMASELKSSKGPKIDPQWDPKLFSSRKAPKRSLFWAWIIVVFAIGVPIVSAQNTETGSQILNFRLQAIPKGDEVRYSGKILEKNHFKAQSEMKSI